MMCLDAEPLNRPTAKELANTLFEWSNEFKKYYDSSIENQEELIKSEIIKQIEETEQINNNSSTSNLSPLTNKIHPNAIYKSMPFNFINLPEPKNSDNYYEIYDNISTMKHSGIVDFKLNTDSFTCLFVNLSILTVNNHLQKSL
ncbi:unnamed protein product [Rhizophagus irregularis]|nr:unnamed protein product [Rhizophagus irregularis]